MTSTSYRGGSRLLRGTQPPQFTPWGERRRWGRQTGLSLRDPRRWARALGGRPSLLLLPPGAARRGAGWRWGAGGGGAAAPPPHSGLGRRRRWGAGGGAGSMALSRPALGLALALLLGAVPAGRGSSGSGPGSCPPGRGDNATQCRPAGPAVPERRPRSPCRSPDGAGRPWCAGSCGCSAGQ